MSEEQLEVVGGMVAKFKNFKPDLQGPISPEESVRLQLALMDKLTAEHNGQFLSHYGNKEWF